VRSNVENPIRSSWAIRGIEFRAQAANAWLQTCYVVPGSDLRGGLSLHFEIHLRLSLLLGGRCRPVNGEIVRDPLMSSVEFLTCPMWKTVGKDESIQVVGLVLETASERPGANDFNVVAILVLSTANRVIGTRCFHKGSRKRQTTFV
jgi:hypothetical protein